LYRNCRSDANGDYDTAVARFKPSGDLTTGIGSGGTILQDFGGGSDDSGQAVTVRLKNLIVVGGESDAHGTYDFALARYTQK
jgi:hypothetical protein